MLRAVVVGINAYRDAGISDLRHARADAEAIGRLIEDRIRRRERSVRVILDEQATKRNLMVAIGEDLPRLATSEDIVLIYFAGHGSPEIDSAPDVASRYIVAHDTEQGSVYATGIDMEHDLKKWCERIRHPKLVLIVLDTCFSGRAGGRTFEGAALHQRRSRLRSAGPVSLRQMDIGEGRLMLTACDDDEVAREDATLGHGVFTHFLMEAWRREVTGHAAVSITSLYDDVALAVREHTGGRQMPVLNGRSRGAHLPRLV